MRQDPSKAAAITTATWPLWLGITGTAIAVAAMAVFGTQALLDSAVPANHISSHATMQTGLHAAFLLIALGALRRMQTPLSTQWRWAIGGALLVLSGGVAGEVLAMLGNLGWAPDLGAPLGAADSVENRLLRLGAMAAFAVPMLVLLAAGELQQPAPVDANRLAKLLVRWEPLLFAIGVTTLAGLLVAAAFVNRELTWLSPLGADTTVAACAAAAIRARWRADSLAFGAWLLVCAGLAVGLLMGIYSFGGPIPAPAFLSDYNALPRVLLRDGHVMLLVLGIAGIALTATRDIREYPA